MANYNPPKNKITWTPEMLRTLIQEFPVTFNDDLAAKLHVSPRTMHRKADELGLKKAPDFEERTRTRKGERISRALKKSGPNSGQFRKGEHRCPEHEFKKGHENLTPEQKTRMRDAQREKRIKTIYEERLRLKYGLPQQTKIKLRKRYYIKPQP